MGLLSKLGTIAGTAIGGPIGGMIGGALGSAAGGVLAGGAAKKQTKNALNDLNAAQAQGLTALGGARDASIGYLSPYNQLGGVGAQGVTNMLTPGYDYRSNDPGYSYLVDQMHNATERGAAAAGGVQSGGFYKALQRNSAGLAAQDFGNAFNRNFQTAGLGLNAANSMANAQSSYGANTANLLSNMARARVPVYGARGDAIAGQYGSLFGALDGPDLGSLFGLGGSGGSKVEAKGLMPGDFKLAGATNWLPGGF